MSEIVHKVTAFITRDQGTRREILVFQHPTAGIQLPAGTVERGEDIKRAVIREAQEETGIETFALHALLGGITNELGNGECIITQTIHVRLEPDEKAMPFERTFGRGATVSFHESVNGWAHVSYTEFNQVPNPNSIHWKIEGWVPDGAISHDKTRHFFHLITQEETPDRWSLDGDAGHIFEPFWAPLSPRPRLVPPQDGWLEVVYDQLIGVKHL
jgi:8-oxo-dGTP pyrophosphatase MutT (NUDIX family)